MDVFRKTALSPKWAGGFYKVSALISLGACIPAFVSPVLIPTCIILKMISVPVVLYLFSRFKNEEVCFWINLGISKAEYFIIPVAVEFLFFIVLVTLSGILGNVI